MDIHVRLTRRGELATQIHRQILEAVRDGRLRGGERLPPTRELAHRLGVSRNTVGVAYERLVADGVVVGRVGDGSFISPEPIARVQTRRAPPGAIHPIAIWRHVSPRRTAQEMAPAYDFSVGTPDPTRFPFTTWRRLIASEFRASNLKHAAYASPAGHDPLREAIARHVGVSRAVRASPDDVMVTNGAQQAFDLLGRVLISRGTVVAMEDPGYPQARRLFQSLGARVHPVPVDAEGLIVGALPARARIVYVTPSHQFPLGTPMSFTRRNALLDWAERRSAVIIEDDYDSEFRFAGRPLDPLQSLDRTGRVIYVGSFSKVLLPALRLGFLIAPASLQPALHAARQLTDWHGEQASQAALARFIDQGLLARHIRKVTREYADRYQRIATAIERDFHRWLRLVPSAAGIHLCAEIRPGAKVDVASVARLAEEKGVRVRALSNFFLGKPDRAGLVIGYGAIPTARIDEGLRRLAECFHPRSRG